MVEALELGRTRRAAGSCAFLFPREACFSRLFCACARRGHFGHAVRRRVGHSVDSATHLGRPAVAVVGKAFLLMVLVALAFSDLCECSCSPPELARPVACGIGCLGDGPAYILAFGESHSFQPVLGDEACAIPRAGRAGSSGRGINSPYCAPCRLDRSSEWRTTADCGCGSRWSLVRLPRAGGNIVS